jgi:hypothetical protein
VKPPRLTTQAGNTFVRFAEAVGVLAWHLLTRANRGFWWQLMSPNMQKPRSMSYSCVLLDEAAPQPRQDHFFRCLALFACFLSK